MKERDLFRPWTVLRGSEAFQSLKDGGGGFGFERLPERPQSAEDAVVRTVKVANFKLNDSSIMIVKQQTWGV